MNGDRAIVFIILLLFQLSYRSFWSQKIIEKLVQHRERCDDGDQLYLSVNDLSEETSIRKEDIISTLQVYFSIFSSLHFIFQNFEKLLFPLG